ncbi:hypothetical protein PoB_001928800 [Plakobranchus ocellatus]|uniref:Uncharacterized protein n=1 Tax=Plakobranchus ocellatus TaxID=259542 RepID=A0AAV3ZEA3_9GAST|nr:hypothetical protein PoB_001928800 [Plakobranchus ocellatus]
MASSARRCTFAFTISGITNSFTLSTVQKGILTQLSGIHSGFPPDLLTASIQHQDPFPPTKRKKNDHSKLSKAYESAIMYRPRRTVSPWRPDTSSHYPRTSWWTSRCVRNSPKYGAPLQPSVVPISSASSRTPRGATPPRGTSPSPTDAGDGRRGLVTLMLVIKVLVRRSSLCTLEPENDFRGHLSHLTTQR